ncbi:hypothetical protein ACWEDF_02280 [Micromonospora chersina]
MLLAEKFPAASIVMSQLRHALEADSRVAEVISTNFEAERMGTYRVYRHATPNEPTPLSGDILRALKLSDPIAFKVHVPRKNQKPFRGHLDIPSDDYWVAWDGITMVAAWPHKKGTPFPRSGGHIAIDILRDAVTAAGFELYGQPCSPNCTNGFAHTTLVVGLCDDEPGTENVYERNGSFVDVHLHAPEDTGAWVQSLTKDIGYESQLFAQYKNQARRIRDIEKTARDMAEEVLSINIQQIHLSRYPLGRRVANWGVSRERRRRVMELIALLWLAFAQIEATRRDWSEMRRRLEDAAARYGTGCLFETDRLDDDGAIESLDLSFIKAAVEQSAARQDSQTMASATALGALAATFGAIAGAIATALAG